MSGDPFRSNNQLTTQDQASSAAKQSKQRQWQVYEKNWLKQHDYSLDNLEQYGQKPVEYIVGQAPFYGYDFKVDSQVLIPRAETAELISPILSHVRHLVARYMMRFGLDRKQELRPFIIDVGTGCGNLAITLLLETMMFCNVYPLVVAIDIDSEALAIAQDNADHLISTRLPPYHRDIAPHCLHFLESDLLADFDWQHWQDCVTEERTLSEPIIVANLPYIPQRFMSDLPPSVKEYEPNLALDGGVNGSTLIKRLLQQVRATFDQAKLWLEFDSRTQGVISELEAVGMKPEQVEIKTDSFDRDRFLFIDWQRSSD
jgi:release factor glutamine methyltransferase